MSVDYRLAHKVTPHFEGRGVFTFTVNAPADIARLCASDAIAVILTDLPNQRAACSGLERRLLHRSRRRRLLQSVPLRDRAVLTVAGSRLHSAGLVIFGEAMHVGDRA
ncbi:MAG: hypothetical protein HPM95_12510 [Alphaproteobacteria bacterium]|nr:hypothetical protein [Alphaproteobacteria bacterium]